MTLLVTVVTKVIKKYRDRNVRPEFWHRVFSRVIEVPGEDIDRSADGHQIFPINGEVEKFLGMILEANANGYDDLEVISTSVAQISQ